MKKTRAGYFLVGPTAVGKSAVAQRIAERDGYEILSADSMVVYRGMDIGTAKPSGDERRRVTYHGLDLVSPAESFSVWEYCRLAGESAGPAEARGRLMVAGGTGLYVKALVEGLAPVPGTTDARRAHWNRVLEQGGAEALCDALKKLHADDGPAEADRRNPRRLIRALEKAEAGFRERADTWKNNRSYAPLAGLTMDTAALNRRIEDRVRTMYRAGLVDEVRTLLARHGELSKTARQAIGYAEAIGVLEGRHTEDEAVDLTAKRTRQLAKRQRTWFRHQLNVVWIEAGPDADPDDAAERVRAHWRKHGATEMRG